MEFHITESGRIRGIDTADGRPVINYPGEEIFPEPSPPLAMRYLERISLSEVSHFMAEHPDYDMKGNVRIMKASFEKGELKGGRRRHFLAAAEDKLKREDNYLLEPRYQSGILFIRKQELSGVLFVRGR